MQTEGLVSLRDSHIKILPESFDFSYHSPSVASIPDVENRTSLPAGSSIF
jgi:hypothetical protein